MRGGGVLGMFTLSEALDTRMTICAVDRRRYQHFIYRLDLHYAATNGNRDS